MSLNYLIIPKGAYSSIIKQHIDIKDSSAAIRVKVYYPVDRTGRIDDRLVWIPRVIDNNDKLALIFAEYIKLLNKENEIIVDKIYYVPRTKMLFIDFLEFGLDIQGGAIDEFLFIYALAKTLDYSFPYIEGIQFLIKGEYSNTLNGHISIQDPIIIDRFIRNGDFYETG